MPHLKTEVAAFLTERYEKELEFFQVYDQYSPDFKKTLLSSKFYSKYERPSNEAGDPVLMEKIKNWKYDTPRQKYPCPMTENQRYGWYIEPLVPLDRADKRFYQPRVCSDFIKHELQQKMDECTLPKVKFTGIPFKTQ